jgi:multisubunit Na+/H+ antiporter MnhB subunit
MLGALIPFLILLVFGVERALKKFPDRAKFAVLAGMILFMLVFETATDWPVFSSQYNWFHL